MNGMYTMVMMMALSTGPDASALRMFAARSTDWMVPLRADVVVFGIVE